MELDKEISNICENLWNEYFTKKTFAIYIQPEKNEEYVDDLSYLYFLCSVLDKLKSDTQALKTIENKKITKIGLPQRVYMGKGPKDQVLEITSYGSVFIMDTDDWDHEWNYDINGLTSKTKRLNKLKKTSVSLR